MARAVETYEQAIEYLYGRINYERVSAASFSARDLKLDRMAALLARLGNPQLRLPAVHIAGTKGKGSTAAMTAEILRAGGHRTGLFTSPHIDKFEERMRVDGTMPSPAELVELVNGVAEPVAEMDRMPQRMSPTYFEIATAMSWLYFEQQRAEVAVLEVGLGGRLDATNVCAPEATAITSISRDHTHLLGSRLAEIAREKGGIVKAGVPVVSGVEAAEAREVVVEICRQHAAPLYELGREIVYRVESRESMEERLAVGGQRSASGAMVDGRWSMEKRSAVSGVRSAGDQGADGRLSPSTIDLRPSTIDQGADGRCAPDARGDALLLSGVSCHSPLFRVSSPWGTRDGLTVPLLGEHQLRNAALAVGIAEVMDQRGWRISDEAMRRGLANVRWPVRIEVLQSRPIVIVDAAHNWASAQALVQTLEAEFRARRRILIFAATQDKDVGGLLRQLVPRFDTVILTRYLNNPRGVPVRRLEGLMQSMSCTPAHVTEDPTTAWQLAKRLATSDDLICISGSFFIASELRELILDDAPATGASSGGVGEQPGCLTQPGC